MNLLKTIIEKIKELLGKCDKWISGKSKDSPMIVVEVIFYPSLNLKAPYEIVVKCSEGPEYFEKKEQMLVGALKQVIANIDDKNKNKATFESQS